MKFGDCPVKIDATDEANWEVVQVCKDLMVSGVAAGVHCDRTRNKELTDKCPWFKRQ